MNLHMIFLFLGCLCSLKTQKEKLCHCEGRDPIEPFDKVLEPVIDANLDSSYLMAFVSSSYLS